jgi:tetratricopeptide (TPR) repeat protein
MDERFNDARNGDVDWNFVNDLRLLTDQNLADESYREALYSMKPLAKFTRIIYGENSLEYAKIQLELVDVYGMQEKYLLCEQLLRRALAIYETHPDSTSLQRIGTRNSLGYILHSLERHDESNQVLDKSIRDCEQELRELSMERGATASPLLTYCDQAERFRKGERWIS